MSHFMEIDGSILEGGGQVLRISMSLSAILGVPIRVSNIRAGRGKPGLAAQHLKGLELVADMCGGKLKGGSLGSLEIEFTPGKIKGGHYTAEIQTAGSISLLLQIALPVALLADGPVTFELSGGTNAEMAPQIDYMEQVFRPLLQRFNADFNINIVRRGYFPKGGGHVTVEVNPVKSFGSVILSDPGEVKAIRGSSFVAGVLPLKMAVQMAEGAKGELRAYKNIDIKTYKEDPKIVRDNCNGMILWAELSSGCILGADALGRRGRDPRALGAGAGRELHDTIRSGACLDTHAQDQAIIFMALAGHSSVKVGEVTLHTQTAMHIAELIAKVKFSVEPDGANNVISCTGLGFVNKNLPPE